MRRPGRSSSSASARAGSRSRWRATGIDVIGVDSSAGMLEVCRAQAALAGVEERLDLRLGDYREPPVEGARPARPLPVPRLPPPPLRRGAPARPPAARALLADGGRLVFDVFTPGPRGHRGDERPLARARARHLRACRLGRAKRVLTLSLRGPAEETTMALAWVSQAEWADLLDRAGFEVEACYGWFDRRPWAGEDDSIWIARRRVVG